MPLHQKSFTGLWSGLITDRLGSSQITVEIKAAADGSLYGSYFFPRSKPAEQGGDFTAELYGQSLFVKTTTDGSRLNFHMNVIGEKRAEMMMFGAIPRPKGNTPRSTVTLFQLKTGEEAPVVWPVVKLWQAFFLKGL
jgi:hypothetical protein